QFSKLQRDAGPTSASRFPFPKQPKSFPMPTDQRVRFHDGQSRRPVEKAHQLPKHEAIRIGCAAWFLFPLDIHRQLFAEEEILGSEGGRGSKPQIHERHWVNKNGEDGESENTSVTEHERKNLINRANEYGGDGFSADGVFAEHTGCGTVQRRCQRTASRAAPARRQRQEGPSSGRYVPGFRRDVVEAGGISDVQELNATAIYAGVEDSFDSPIRTLQIARDYQRRCAGVYGQIA